MAEESEYELLPHEELQELRDEIARLKQDPLAATSQADDLKHAVDRLTVTMNKFISLMTKTNEELLDQFQQTSFIEQFAKMSANQEQIAKGIVSVAKMLKKMHEEKPKEHAESPHLESGFPQQPSQPPMNQPGQPPTNFPDDLPPLNAMAPQQTAQTSQFSSAQPSPDFSPQGMPPQNMSAQNMSSQNQPPSPSQSQQLNSSQNQQANNLPEPPQIPQDDFSQSSNDLPPPPPHKHGLFHRK